jgi:glycerol-3-phosphate cytidylyltransferase/D-beta-D-heptose 7-phosphate kinase/D-beta-D-heptose 1-phosphate adenosyltransferase
MTRPVAVIVSGYFSPLHVGHLDMIESGAEIGDKLIVIVNNNDQQKAKKGKVIIDEQDRLRLVSALRDVDDALISIDADRTVRESIRQVAQKYTDHDLIFANGGDRESGAVVPEAETCEEFGIKMIFDMGGNTKADSSTRINMELGLETEASALPSADA